MLVIGPQNKAKIYSCKLVILTPWLLPRRKRIDFELEGVNKITVKGIDKQLVGEIAAEIKAVRSVEPYKGKGIRYAGERVRKKAGKSAKVAGATGA